MYLPVKERIAAIVQRAIKWSTLRHIPVSERKVAVILHNYPPKNSNIGSAAGLDTPESVLRLLRDMKAEGYTIDTVPENKCRLDGCVTSHMTNDRSMLTDELLASAEGRLVVMITKHILLRCRKIRRQQWLNLGAKPQGMYSSTMMT